MGRLLTIFVNEADSRRSMPPQIFIVLVAQRQTMQMMIGSFEKRIPSIGVVGAIAITAIVDSDDTPAVDAPRHLVLVLACGDAGVALDATICVTKEFQTGQEPMSWFKQSWQE